MSDGPYRALPMSRQWKRLAAAIENSTFELPAMRARLEEALFDDCRESGDAVGGELRRIFRSREGMLFPDQDTSEIDALRRTAGPNGVVPLLLDCAAHALAAGRSGEAALIEATTIALELRRDQRFLQVEEHYLRAAPQAATNVRARLMATTLDSDLSPLARAVLGIDRRPRRQTQRATGLDDGPPR